MIKVRKKGNTGGKKTNKQNKTYNRYTQPKKTLELICQDVVFLTENNSITPLTIWKPKAALIWRYVVRTTNIITFQLKCSCFNMWKKINLGETVSQLARIMMKNKRWIHNRLSLFLSQIFYSVDVSIVFWTRDSFGRYVLGKYICRLRLKVSALKSSWHHSILVFVFSS